MADGKTPLSDYLEAGAPSPDMDEWTQGYEECRNRLFGIVGQQLRTLQPAATSSAAGLKPCGWLAGSAHDGGETMFYQRETAQSECDQHNDYERSRPDFDAENLRMPEPVYRHPPGDRPTAKGCSRSGWCSMSAQRDCRDDGRCQYAIDHGVEGIAACPVGKCCMPLCRTCDGAGSVETGIAELGGTLCDHCDGTGFGHRAPDQGAAALSQSNTSTKDPK